MFQSRGESVIIDGCQRGRACWTHTDSPGFVRGPRLRGYSVTRRPGSYGLTGVKKTACGCCGTTDRSFYDHKVRRIRDLSCPPGSPLPRDPGGRRSGSMTGSATDEFFAIETSHSDSDTFQAFLDEADKFIEFQRPRNVLILDNTSWHKRKSTN